MKEVYMEAIIRPAKPFDEDRDNLSFKGYVFCINGNWFLSTLRVGEQIF